MKGWIINGTDGLEAYGNTVSVAFPVEGLKILNAFYAKKAKKPLKKTLSLWSKPLFWAGEERLVL